MTPTPTTPPRRQGATPTIRVWVDDTAPTAIYRRVEHDGDRPVDFHLDPHGNWVRDADGVLAARLNLPAPMRELDRTARDQLLAHLTSEALANGTVIGAAAQFALTAHEITRLAALSRLGEPSASPTSGDVAELAWYAARLRLISRDLRDDLSEERAYQPTIAAAVAVHLADDADWEAAAAWCAGDIVSAQLPSGEYSSTITIPNVGHASDGDWIVLDLDGSFSIHRELRAPTPGMTLWDEVRDTAPPERDATEATEHGAGVVSR